MKRFEVVRVFNQEHWVLKVQKASVIFRLGDSFFVPTIIAGNLVVASPYHHYLCDTMLHGTPMISIAVLDELFKEN